MVAGSAVRCARAGSDCRELGAGAKTRWPTSGKRQCLAKINIGLRFGPRTARWRQQQGFGVSTPPTQHRRAIWALPTPATRETGSVGTREKKQKSDLSRARWPPRRPSILSGPKKASSRGPAAGNPHIARSRESRKQKNRPLDAQASRVESAARRLLVSGRPARAAATAKEWTTGRRRRRCCR